MTRALPVSYDRCANAEFIFFWLPQQDNRTAIVSTPDGNPALLLPFRTSVGTAVIGPAGTERAAVLSGNVGGNRTAQVKLWDWAPVGTLKVDFGFLFDPLAAIFVLLITGVGFLIHLYAVGYMAHDPGRRPRHPRPQHRPPVLVAREHRDRCGWLAPHPGIAPVHPHGQYRGRSPRFGAARIHRQG